MKTVLLSICFLVSMGAAVYFYTSGNNSGSSSLLAENEALKLDLLEASKEREVLQGMLKSKDQDFEQLSKKVDSLEALLKKASEVKKDAELKSPQQVGVEGADKEEEKEPSPAEKKRIAQLQKFLGKEIDKNYAGIFQDLGLNEDEIAQIREKLLGRDTEIVSAVFKSIMQSLPTEEGQTQEQALAQSILESIETTNKDLALDLGDSFDAFRLQEQQGFTLRELGNFEGMLSASPLGDDQRVGLNDLMFEHHNSVLQDVAAGNTTFKKADEELVKNSAEFLNEDQQKTLSSYLKLKRGGN